MSGSGGCRFGTIESTKAGKLPQIGYEAAAQYARGDEKARIEPKRQSRSIRA